MLIKLLTSLLINSLLIVILGSSEHQLTSVAIAQDTPKQNLSNKENKEASHFFTAEDVAKHNSEKDCFMSFAGKVYNFTDYLPAHLGYMDITSWCGKDMTEAFRTKINKARDHNSESYEMLAQFEVGLLKTNPEIQVKLQAINIDLEDKSSAINKTPPVQTEQLPVNKRIYHPFELMTLTIICWLIHKYLVHLFKSLESKPWLLTQLGFTRFWNFALLVSSLPSVIFGFILSFRLVMQGPLWTNFNFLWWHVEGSSIFGSIGLIHIYLHWRYYFQSYLTSKNGKN